MADGQLLIFVIQKQSMTTLNLCAKLVLYVGPIWHKLKKNSRNGSLLGVRMKSRILPENVKVEFCQITFMLPLFEHVTNFESAKLGRFGPE